MSLVVGDEDLVVGDEELQRKSNSMLRDFEQLEDENDVQGEHPTSTLSAPFVLSIP